MATAASNQSDEFVVVIDAGHGGHDVGAVDNGAREKDINLGVAKKLKELVNKKLKNVKTIMTRDGDTFVSLQERANIANRNRGDLFISIHTNSVDKTNPNRKSVKGASVYALGVHKDASNLQVAQRENSVIELESDFQQKYSGFDPSKDESYIIFEMAQKKNLGQSLKFANEAQKQLVAHAGRADRGVKQAGFWVLWATSMPAVLVELDFICNPTQAAFINSEEGQTKMAQSLFNALEKYIAAPSSHISPSANKPGVSQNNKSDKSVKVEREKSDNAANVSNSEKLLKGNNNKAAEKKSKKKKKSKKTPAVEEAAPVAQTITETDDTPTLVAVARTREKKVDHSPTPSTRSSSISGSRKRRSASSKRASDAKEFETTAITAKDENAFLAKVETKEVTVAVNDDQTPAEDNSKKGKKQKQKKQDKKNSASKDNSQKSKGSYKKFSVSSTGDVLTSEPAGGGKMVVKAEPKKHVSVSNHKAKVSHLKTVYKIQILVSADQLKDNNPRFCGLKPISSIKENGMYKYTYGESEDRAEMERELKKVRAKIPDAFIISAKK